MRKTGFLLLAILGMGNLARAQEPVSSPANWTRAVVGPMKTSIYVGSVTLSTKTFERQGSTLSTTYEAKVFPWFFWGETGRITITLADAQLARLAQGETAEFTGEAFNHKHKPRAVSGRAQPIDAKSGKMKIRIKVDDLELIFNGTYRFEDQRADEPRVAIGAQRRVSHPVSRAIDPLAQSDRRRVSYNK